MRIAGVDFPEQVLSALRDDRLVMFAGAGVSMGEPANLPNFRDLASKVAQGTGHILADDDPVDRFLGNLADSGVDVHNRTADALSASNLRPTELHRQLLRCFRSVESVRVVTTNFDLLFEKAADKEIPLCIEAFRAPALPLGTEFEGIVHLHGSVERPRRMTLTDADFGRAYLIERWSPRFLVDVFRTYTVLFVGYSHDDTVMNYLGRALAEADRGQTDSPNRFVLIPESSEEDRWAPLGISPIRYQKNADEDHTGLVEGVTGLADYMQRGLLEWQRTIGDIARGLPSLDPERQDLISDAISDVNRVRFFTEGAEDPAWLGWLDDRNHLNRLFVADLATTANETGRQLAWWMSNKFAWNHPVDLLDLFSRHGMRIGRELWTQLAMELVAKGEETNEDRAWEPDVISKWISLLLDNIPHDLLHLDAHLRSLAQAAYRAGLDDAVVAVFDAIAGLSGTGRHGFVDRDWTLNDVWETCLAPRVALVAEDLLPAVLARLRERHRWACTWENATRESGLANWRRGRIEAREDKSYRYDSNDVLIDAARESLVYLVENEPLVASGHIDQMIRADAPLPRRIAIHCTSMRHDLTADEKTKWLLGHIGLHDRACRRELYLFMQATFRDLSKFQRQRVLAAIDDDPSHYHHSSELSNE